MRDFLLLTAVAAAFLFGFFVMGKLGRFLESNSRATAFSPRTRESSLRLGLSDPLVTDSVAGILGPFTGSRLDISVCLFSGSAEELLGALSGQQLDAVFLPVNVALPEGTHYNMGEVFLARTPVITRYSSLEIEPVTEGEMLQNVLWDSAGGTAIAGDFIGYLKTREDWRDKDGSAASGPGSALSCDS